MKKTGLLLCIICILFSNSGLIAQENEEVALDDMYAMSLEDLMDIEINVASKSKSNLRESPGIISVISSEQIQKMGARDLIDILESIPGFSFGTDVQGVVGVGIRGNWAHEGKMSLQIDGLEMNETLFSTNQFGRHFPVDHIKRIEIIRGPGSSLYGGYAELGVVNIITKTASEIDGIGYSATWSEMKETYGQRNVSFSYGKTINNCEITLHTFLGTANRSDRKFTGINSDYDDLESYNMADYSLLNSMHVNLSMVNNDFKTRLIVDSYHNTVKDAFDVVSSAYNIKYNTLILNSQYDYKATDKLTFTPEFVYKRQEPWNNGNQLSKDSYIFYNVTAQRVTGRLTANLELNDKINIIGGIELYTDQAASPDKFDYFIAPGENDSLQATIHYMNYAGFIQGEYKTKFANFLLGARLEEHSQFGSSFVPRFAVTKAFDNFHFKILASQAFRAPGISNIQTNGVAIEEGMPGIDPIKPEKTNVLEIEVGYKIGSNMFVSANVFDITINDPIVYFYDEDYDIEGYSNYDKTGTSGAEIDFKISGNWGNANLTYSHYLQNNKNEVEVYGVPDAMDSMSMLAFPRHKVTLNSTFKIWKGLSINPWFVFSGEKYGWTAEWDEDENDGNWDVNTTFDPTFILNLFVKYDNFFVDKLSLGFGVYNILDHEINYIQPFLGYHSPLPGNSREFMFKLSYNLY